MTSTSTSEVQPASKGFLFINKSTGNLSHKSRTEVAKINSHCKRNLLYQRHKIAYEILPSSAQLSTKEPQTLVHVEGDGQNRWRAESAAPDDLHWSARHAVSYPVSEHDSIHDRALDGLKALLRARGRRRTSYNHVRTPSLYIGLGQESSDPFSAAAIEIDASAANIVSAWQKSTLERLTQSERPGDQSLFQGVPYEWALNVTSNAAMLHGILAGALSFASEYLRETPTTGKLRLQSLEHHTKCVKAIRKQVADQSMDGEVALHMIHLAHAYSYHHGQFESCKVHYNAMRTVVSNMGGARKLHWNLRYILIRSDANISLQLPKRPTFEMDDWGSFAWEEDPITEGCRPLIDKKIDSVFCKSITLNLPLGPFSDNIKKLFYYHQQLLTVESLLFDARVIQSPNYNAAKEWTMFRRPYLCLLTADLQCDFLEWRQQSNSNPSAPSLFSLAFCLATNYQYQFIHWSLSREDFAISIVPFHHLCDCLERLVQCLDIDDCIDQDALLWLFFVGSCAEIYAQQAFFKVGIRSSWHCEQFILLANQLNLSSWESAKGVLARFTYREKISDGYVRKLYALPRV